MSLGEFFSDVGHGNFTHAYERAKDWWNNGAPPWLKSFVSKAEADGEKALETAVEVGAQDILAGGITTDSFVKAAKDIWASMQAQGKAYTLQEVFAALNLSVNEKVKAQANEPAETPAEAAPAPDAGQAVS